MTVPLVGTERVPHVYWAKMNDQFDFLTAESFQYRSTILPTNEIWHFSLYFISGKFKPHYNADLLLSSLIRKDIVFHSSYTWGSSKLLKVNFTKYWYFFQLMLIIFPILLIINMITIVQIRENKNRRAQCTCQLNITL